MIDMPELKKKWNNILNIIKNDISSDAAFATWIKPLIPYSINNKICLFSVCRAPRLWFSSHSQRNARLAENHPPLRPYQLLFTLVRIIHGV